ncbi:substrate-binding domain-containing protein [Actinoallomurus sp. NPDC052274]|uniref:substrate-binding domain-containing protein n=1 Tax=Actinoallomurus sp. NPDC052274 TaxID=3155420 RepID=UPI00341BCFA7
MSEYVGFEESTPVGGEAPRDRDTFTSPPADGYGAASSDDAPPGDRRNEPYDQATTGGPRSGGPADWLPYAPATPPYPAEHDDGGPAEAPSEVTRPDLLGRVDAAGGVERSTTGPRERPAVSAGLGATGAGIRPPDPWDLGPDHVTHDRAARRRKIRALTGLLAGVTVLVLLVGVAVYALSGKPECGGGPVALNVAAAPEVAPAIVEITRAFNKEHHSIDGRCVQAGVQAADPAGVARMLSGAVSAPGTARPDVWIPDSSIWLAMAHVSSGAAEGGPAPLSVARTPVVVATTRSLATAMSGQKVPLSWETLLRSVAAPSGAGNKAAVSAKSVRLQILDPASQAAGIGTIVMTRVLLQRDPNALPIFSRLVQDVRKNVSPTTQALLAGMSRKQDGKAPVLIAPEQAVWKYNHATTDPAAVLYPREGQLSLDYPFAVTTGDRTRVSATALLAQAMNTGQARAAVQALGFRTPDGRPGKDFAAGGLNTQIPRALPTPSADDVTQTMQVWSKLSLRARALCVLDVSGSMAEPVRGGMSRLQATAKIGTGALATLPDDTDVGLWTFSTRLVGSRDYRVDVPIGPLSTQTGSSTRRQAILGVLGRVRPKPDGDTGLYDTVLAAVRSLRKTYKQGYYNNVLLLTDGKNDDPSGISLSELRRALVKENDPDRPIPVLAIGFGPSVDMKTMQSIAEETNGAAYHATDSSDVQRILQEIIAQRICSTQKCR